MLLMIMIDTVLVEVEKMKKTAHTKGMETNDDEKTIAMPTKKIHDTNEVITTRIINKTYK